MKNPQRSDFALRLAGLLPQAIAWAIQQSEIVLKNGEPFDALGLKVACAVGVNHPERIRVWTVIELPTP